MGGQKWTAWEGIYQQAEILGVLSNALCFSEHPHDTDSYEAGSPALLTLLGNLLIEKI